MAQRSCDPEKLDPGVLGWFLLIQSVQGLKVSRQTVATTVSESWGCRVVVAPGFERDFGITLPNYMARGTSEVVSHYGTVNFQLSELSPSLELVRSDRGHGQRGLIVCACLLTCSEGFDTKQITQSTNQAHGASGPLNAGRERSRIKETRS